MDDTPIRLDGNAIAGLLQEALVNELTSARGACASCGAVGELGGQHLYTHPDSPGAVLRCHVCEAALMVLVHARGRFRIGLQGMTWLEVCEEGSAAR